jgi:hypothetical protein
MGVEAWRRQNSLRKVFRAAVPLVTATPCGSQQEEPEKLKPDSEPPGWGRPGPQGQILEGPMLISATVRACRRLNVPNLFPNLLGSPSFAGDDQRQ